MSSRLLIRPRLHHDIQSSYSRLPLCKQSWICPYVIIWCPCSTQDLKQTTNFCQPFTPCSYLIMFYARLVCYELLPQACVDIVVKFVEEPRYPLLKPHSRIPCGKEGKTMDPKVQPHVLPTGSTRKRMLRRQEHPVPQRTNVFPITVHRQQMKHSPHQGAPLFLFHPISSKVE